MGALVEATRSLGGKGGEGQENCKELDNKVKYPVSHRLCDVLHVRQTRGAC